VFMIGVLTATLLSAAPVRTTERQAANDEIHPYCLPRLSEFKHVTHERL
jgi:hypothetical protein